MKVYKKNKLKILIAGNWQFDIYEEAFAKALLKYNVEIIKFYCLKRFKILYKYSSYFPFEPYSIKRINKELIKLSNHHKPDIILFWRPTHFLPNTIKKLSKMNIKTVSYNNDNPFIKFNWRKLKITYHIHWFWYLRSLKFFDYNFFYRKENCFDAVKYKAKNINLLFPYFIPWKDKKINIYKNEKLTFECDIVFAGHYENDNRELYLIDLVKAGYKVKLWGDSTWDKKVLGEYYEYFRPIRRASKESYGKALCGAKICLAFLSKENKDKYTRRCFEIPAYGKLLLSERTIEMKEIYEEDVEACFFSSRKELLEKVKWLLNNPEKIKKISEAGHKKVLNSGFDIYSQAGNFLEKIV